MVRSDWWEVLYPVKGVLKCATTMSGEQSVTMDGVLLMLELLVDKLGFLQQVKAVCGYACVLGINGASIIASILNQTRLV